jgi:hypothetical protein
MVNEELMKEFVGKMERVSSNMSKAFGKTKKIEDVRKEYLKAKEELNNLKTEMYLDILMKKNQEGDK